MQQGLFYRDSVKREKLKELIVNPLISRVSIQLPVSKQTKYTLIEVYVLQSVC
jgi:hypothetical protein